MITIHSECKGCVYRKSQLQRGKVAKTESFPFVVQTSLLSGTVPLDIRDSLGRNMLEIIIIFFFFYIFYLYWEIQFSCNSHFSLLPS